MDEKIKQLLSEAYAPEHLEIINESHLHAGHAGDDGSGETHYKIAITAKKFDGMNRVARQRDVMKLLKPCFDAGLHALTLRAKSVK
jgi:BolA protein